MSTIDLTQQQKDELFDEFLIKLEDANKEERVRRAKNAKAMRGVTAYYNDNFGGDLIKPCTHQNELFWVDKDGNQTYKYYGLYSAYLKLRETIPNIVMIKKHKGKVRHYYDIHKREEYSRNPTLEESDAEEATKVGKLLLDTLWNYLTDDEK